MKLVSKISLFIIEKSMGLANMATSLSERYQKQIERSISLRIFKMISNFVSRHKIRI